jgi:hypothetical protein
MPIIRSLSTAAAAAGLPRNVVVTGLLVVGGPIGPTTTNSTVTTTFLGKPESAAAVDRLLMMGIKVPETRCVVSKRKTINL